MKRVNFEDGTLIKQATVTIDEIEYTVTPAQRTGNTPLSAFVLNKMQDNIEEDIDSIKSHKYISVVTTAMTRESEVTIPCNYRVGTDCLDVFLNGEKLIKSIQENGEDGHYKEVGETGSISNKILIGSTEYTIDVGDCFEFIVRGNFDA